MKTSYTSILARKLLLSFLAFVFILSVAALFVRKTITDKLAHIALYYGNIGQAQDGADHTLLLLRQAEDDFQASLLNTNSTKGVAYKIKLYQAFEQINTLIQKDTDTTAFTSAQSEKMRVFYNRKIESSDKLHKIKHSFDSLLTGYAKFNGLKNEKLPLFVLEEYKKEQSKQSSIDTVNKTSAIVKKGFFRRLKEAVLNKKDSSAEKNFTEVKQTFQINETEQIAHKIIIRDQKIYEDRLKQLQQNNHSILSTQRSLIALNNHISNELEQLINEIKEINYHIAEEFRSVSFKNYREASTLLNKLYLVTLIMVILFAMMLIGFIIQLNRAELLLRKENERSVTIAQQKMDLLLYMSHEIRNPLTTIKGFLEVFPRTSLDAGQIEIFNSINLSSDMLLLTLNDTLDAAKMENNEFKINNEPFNPAIILKMVTESMEFSATKKGLALNFIFNGDKDAIILGDSFRLKQIMVNLVSNAIKYTQQGSITVTAELLNKENKLQVEVVDTGVGINQEEQNNLFSKYYQTNSSKGHVGTGLGLFICNQLIKLQGGKISVKSHPEMGSTFSFSIPYLKSNEPALVQRDVYDLHALLDGITVLAVDDNELNLVLLEVMMSKWNVNFLKAGNGMEALDIIKKTTVNLILTDMQMPEMDGNELFSAIKKLNEPHCNMPVILITGSTEHLEKNMDVGFSGIMAKPFNDEMLAEQLMNALQKTA